MPNYAQLKTIFRKAMIIRAPKHRLSTFGASEIKYCLITDVSGFTDRSRLRTGHVRADRPNIITKEQLQNRFFGFGEEAPSYGDWLLSQYGNALRGIEYQFKNQSHSSRIELTSPEKLTQNLTKEFDRRGEYRNALLRGSDKFWELTLMKFIVEETLASFNSNVQELEERGFFKGEERIIQNHHREIQNLIKKAKEDRNVIPLLAQKLREYKLFDQYQDSFFSLVNR